MTRMIVVDENDTAKGTRIELCRDARDGFDKGTGEGDVKGMIGLEKAMAIRSSRSRP